MKTIAVLLTVTAVLAAVAFGISWADSLKSRWLRNGLQLGAVLIFIASCTTAIAVLVPDEETEREVREARAAKEQKQKMQDWLERRRLFCNPRYGPCPSQP